MNNQDFKHLSFYPEVAEAFRRNNRRRGFRKQTNCMLVFFIRLRAVMKRFRKA